MQETGIVIIGRNEGERLRRCLASVRGRGMPVVYVDSGSVDGSIVLARQMGTDVVELDLSHGFSAARARNAGCARLLDLRPDLDFVQFVDGDCEIVHGWLERARAELTARPDVAVVCGRRRERFPQASVYNRLCDMEWNTPVGEAKSCGGDSMMRVSAFKAAGGFEPLIVAGEEPELCLRLRREGWRILRIDVEMTLHDAAMLRFGQCWKRAVRGGYGGCDVVYRFDEKRETSFARQIRSARIWGLGWPAAVLGAGLAAWWLVSPMAGMTAAALMAMVLAAQTARLAWQAARKGVTFTDALAFAFLTMVGKWAHLVGQWRYLRDRRAGRQMGLIEYKERASFVAADRAGLV